MASDHRAPHDRDEDSAAEHGLVRRELQRLRFLARELSGDDLRSGVWLTKLIRFSLAPYAAEVDAAWFEERYPGLPVEEVVQARIQRSARHAGIEGGLSAGAYTGAVAATLGSAGAASALTLPAAGVSFVLDLLYLSHLQLRLAYDIAVLHRVPLDLDDPEDLGKLIRVAFALKGAEAGREVLGKSVPLAVRPAVKKLLGGGALAATRSVPRVGSYLLQRSLLKFAIPAVGVPVSVGINHWSVRLAGAQAGRAFRAEAVIVDAARRMTAATPHHGELLWVLWLIIKSDALIHEDERLLLKHVSLLVGDLDTELVALSALQSTVDVDPKVVWNRLGAVTGDLAPLYEAAVVAAAIDGKINVNELTNLKKLAECCSVPFDEAAIRAAARRTG